MSGIVFAGIGNQITNIAAGTTRWNQTNNVFEMFDGTNWVTVASATFSKETLAESIQHVQDQIDLYIEEDYKDNATIQDAYQEWTEACERFRVIVSMAEKK